MKLDHIGIAVKNLDEAVKFYKDVLGLELVERENVPEEKVRIAIFKVGDVFIELLEGISEDSAITKFINKRGEGIHHIALRVENVDEVSKKLKERNVPLIYSEPKVVAGGKRKINFIHPKAACGVLLEILERCE
ncbi:MAG: methylmalonyl-CoA epimerase [Desulfurococcales archaeon]|nr:methylmalonyl-CoA epimerase [Desulfurococcales archaeon]